MLLLLPTLPTAYFGHYSVQNVWLDGHLIWNSMALLMSFISSVSHWTHTTELQRLNFKHLLNIVTSVSPLWANALGIKSRHCFEHTMERIHTSLFQTLLLDMLLSSYSLLHFPYSNGERGGPVLYPKLGRALERRSTEDTSGEYLPLHWLERESWEPVLIRLIRTIYSLKALCFIFRTVFNA